MPDSARPAFPAILTDARIYPEPAHGLWLLETHISWIAFAGDFVYKVKKPVDLGFCDFRTLAERERACREELRLNRRYSKDLHLGVVPLAATPQGPRFAADGEVLEWAVKMRRLPEERMLDVLLARGAIDNAMLEGLLDVLLEQQEVAERGPELARFGAPERIAAHARDNLEVLARFAGTGEDALLGTETLSALRGGLEADLKRLWPQFVRRAQGGFVREGHGDLHAGNICFERSRPTLYDCLEFSEELRVSDIVSELAFLAMDLDRRGFPAFGEVFLRRAFERNGDEGGRALVGFYKEYRALVRAKVAALQAQQQPPGDPNRKARLAEARRAVRLAASYRLPPLLVLYAGLPGSGKSWLSARVDIPLAARRLRSDVTRKRLFGAAPNARPKDAAEASRWYSADATAKTYAALLAEADAHLRQGTSVVLDAAHLKRAEREAALRLAGAHGIRALLVWVSVPDDCAAERLKRRAQDPAEASDADQAIRERLHEFVEPPSEWPESDFVAVDGRLSPAEVAHQILEAFFAKAAL